MNRPLDDELRHALRAAAANVDVSEPERSPFSSAVALSMSDIRRPQHRRWQGVGAIAAAVATLLVSVVVLTQRGGGATSPAGLSVQGATASVDGVRFPIPDGANVDVLTDTPSLIAVCVHQSRSNSCADGVTVTVARPDATGHFTELPNPASDPGCEWTSQHVSQQDLADRLAGVVVTECSGADSGLTTTAWSLGDGTLSITTPPGVAFAEAQRIAARIDLSAWASTG